MKLSRRLRDRKDKSSGHIIIAGTGRAGTTLLVQLFTALGFDTGYTIESALTEIDQVSHAGLERENLVSDANPYVIKSPWFSDTLMDALENQKIKIHAAIIPMRSLFSAAESRRRVANEGVESGGLWYTDKPHEQEEKLAIQFYKTVFPLVKHNVQVYFIEFPRFAFECEYLYYSLEHLLSEHNVTIDEIVSAHKAIVQSDKIHVFE